MDVTEVNQWPKLVGGLKFWHPCIRLVTLNGRLYRICFSPVAPLTRVSAAAAAESAGAAHALEKLHGVEATEDFGPTGALVLLALLHFLPLG